jgi:hypothetical protein
MKSCHRDEFERERDARASSKEQFFLGQRSACVLSFRSHLYLKKHTNRFNAWKYDMSTMVLFLVMIFGTRSTKSWKICPRNFRSWNPPPNWSHFVTRFCVIMGPNVTCAAGFGWHKWLAVSSSLDSSCSWSCSRTTTSLMFEGEPDLLNVIEDR